MSLNCIAEALLTCIYLPILNLIREKNTIILSRFPTYSYSFFGLKFKRWRIIVPHHTRNSFALLMHHPSTSFPATQPKDVSNRVCKQATALPLLNGGFRSLATWESFGWSDHNMGIYLYLWSGKLWNKKKIPSHGILCQKWIAYNPVTALCRMWPSVPVDLFRCNWTWNESFSTSTCVCSYVRHT